MPDPAQPPGPFTFKGMEAHPSPGFWLRGKPPQAARRWQAVVAAAFLAYLATLAFLVSRQTYEVALPQFLLGAQQLGHGARLTSEFLPVGYPLVLALGSLVGHWAGARGVQVALSALNILLVCATVVGLYRWLQRRTAPGYALAVALVLGLYPETLRNLSKVSDTNLTTLLLVAMLLALTAMRRSAGIPAATTFGLVLGAAVLVRPNLCLMLALAVPALAASPFRRRAALLLVAFAVSLATYLAVTAATHGKPFWPKNGAYNVFAGANPYTAYFLLHDHNAEESILPALRQHGFHPGLDWHRPSDQPGIDDSRDLRYVPVYRALAVQFVRQHPAQMVRLTLLKLLTFLRPDGAPGLPAPWTSAWLLVKTSVRMGTVLWMVVVVADRFRGGSGPFTAVGLLALLYVLPFLLTNADPRFRTPLDLVLLADTARIFYRWSGLRRGSTYFTSSPRPAA